MTTLNIPSDLPLSRILFKQCKLWVWDFDDTIIDTSVYYSCNMKPDAILQRTDSQLDNEVPQWRYFRRLVEYLVGNGRYIGIASFGTYEIILAYMKRIMGFNQKFFTKANIIAPEFTDRELRRFNQPPNKNEYVYQLMRIYRVQDFKRVVLFDDNASNIADAIGIGIVGVQIGSKNGGDSPKSEKLMFGPWIMADFDKKLTETCGDEIYRNRTYTGLVAKEEYTALAYDTELNNKDNDINAVNNAVNNGIDYGTGSRSWNGYLMEPYKLGVDDSVVWMKNTPAFGTGIGDRKINTKPQITWNSYRMPRKITPQWWNGNYVNVPGDVKTEGYWEPESLGGSSMTFWDKMQSVQSDENKDAKKENKPIIYPSNSTIEGFDNVSNSAKNAKNAKSVNSVSNGSKKTDCGCGIPPTWLMILLFMIVVIIVIVMVKL
jgi:hypothetical protein